MKQFLKDESAVSFGYFVIAAFLIGGTGIWVLFAPLFNKLFISYNQNIAEGIVTAQNQQAMTFHHNVIFVVPLVMLLGVACWGIIRALEKRQEA